MDVLLIYIRPFLNYRSFYLTAFIPASSPPVRPEQSRHLTALLRSVSESSVVRRRAVQQRQVAPSNLSKAMAMAILNDFSHSGYQWNIFEGLNMAMDNC